MRLRRLSSLLILMGLLSPWSGGCASRQPPQTTLKPGEYHKLLQKQKAGVPGEDTALKALPEMTAGEYEALGDAYLRQDNLTMAFVQYDKALRLDPTQIRLRYKMGLLFLQKGLAAEAMHEFQAVLKNNGQHALAYEGIGQALFKMGRLVEAEKNFRQATVLDHHTWRSHNFLGIIYDRQQRFEDAVSAYQAALALRPEQGLLLNNLGMAYYHKGEYEHAVRAFQQALKNGSTNTKTYNNLGLALGKLRRYHEALEAFIRGSDEAKAYNNLGVLYLADGKHKEAIAAFEKAMELSPSYYTQASENLKTARKALVTPLPAATERKP